MNNDKSKSRNSQAEIQYTIINHIARKKLNLTCIEYSICDCIYHLSNNPKSSNWCTCSKQYLADFLGVSKVYVINVLKKLLKKGLIEYPEKRRVQDRRVRTTQLWYDTAIMKTGKQNLPVKKKENKSGKQNLPASKQNLPVTGKQSLHNNEFNNDINKEYNLKQIKNLKKQVWNSDIDIDFNGNHILHRNDSKVENDRRRLKDKYGRF